ncbi:LysR family transcriptional regulator [Dongshaea marina]|uniref:LysR family transcriptional regulator n=1 Tax=Dongshaea marina TaxID=2047966 RepID=UPI000D3E20EC|nr:LysR family transcriptional regulator [Dongshaea marina]
MDWATNLKSFIKVVEEGSFTAAAKQLCSTTSALSKRVSWLEQQLETQLLKRTTRSISLTEAGQLLYERGMYLTREWQSLLDETRSLHRAPTGLLKIGATPTLGSRFLIPIVEQFLERYPKMQIHLSNTTIGQGPKTELDLMINSRLDPQFNSNSFKMYRLFDFTRNFFASPRFLEKSGPIERTEQLESVNVLIWGEQHQRQCTLQDGLTLTLQGNFSTQNSEALLQAARHGLGVLLVPDMMVANELARGELVPILPELTTQSESIYAFFPNLGFEHAKTRLFLDFTREFFDSKQSEDELSPFQDGL